MKFKLKFKWMSRREGSRGGKIDRQKIWLNFMLSIRPNSIWLGKHTPIFYHILDLFLQVYVQNQLFRHDSISQLDAKYIVEGGKNSLHKELGWSWRDCLPWGWKSSFFLVKSNPYNFFQGKGFDLNKLLQRHKNLPSSSSQAKYIISPKEKCLTKLLQRHMCCTKLSLSGLVD